MSILQPSERQLAGASKWVRASSVNSPSTADSKKTKQRDQYVYPICSEVIIEDNDTNSDQNTIYCESTCDTWLHHQCAGIPKSIFESLKNSNKPFYWMYCRLTSYESQLLEFKSTISQLENTVLEVKRKVAKVSQTQGKVEELEVKLTNATKVQHSASLSAANEKAWISKLTSYVMDLRQLLILELK